MFDPIILSFILVFTILIFRKYLLSQDLFSRIFYWLIVLSILLYSGIGASLYDVRQSYIFYYIIYILSVFVGIKFFARNRFSVNKDRLINNFVENYAKFIIVSYTFLLFVDLILPEFKLINLIYPPAPDLKSAFAERFVVKEKSLLEIVVYNIRLLLTPFFYLALYSYKNKPLRLGFLLLFLLYIQYCSSGYLGRGAMVTYLALYLSLLYVWYPCFRKKIVVAVCIGAPSLMIFFVEYVSIRLGGDKIGITLGKAIAILLQDETSYPLWFNQISDRPYSFKDTLDYVYWLVTLPFPFSLNFWNFDFSLNYKISEYLLSVPRGSDRFYVLLPGLVGEAYFAFGKLFWLHGLLYGAVIGAVYRFIKQSDVLLPLGIYLALMLGYYGARGGTGGVYPFILKQMFYFFIILFLYYKYPLKIVLKK